MVSKRASNPKLTPCPMLSTLEAKSHSLASGKSLESTLSEKSPHQTVSNEFVAAAWLMN
jgi:hypothetical protein